MRTFLTSFLLLLSTTIFAQSLGNIIREQPTGTVCESYGAAKGYTEFYKNLIPYELDGVATKYVVSDEDSVYIYNPISGYDSKSWLKGKLDKATGVVTFQLPQLINSEVADDGEGEYEDYIIACKMAYSAELETYLVTPDDQELSFLLEDGTLTMLDNQFVGISNMEGEWYGIGDYEKTINPMTDKMVSPAQEEGVVSCLMKYQTQDGVEASRPVSVKVEDNSIYVQGLAKDNPEAWVKGEVQDGKATFPTKQYLGVNEEKMAHSYFMVLDEGGTWLSSAIFDYTVDPLTLSTEDVLTTNFGKNTASAFDYYKAPTIGAWQNVVAAPVAPAIKDCTPDDGDYSWFTITLSAKTKDGEDLDADKLYYNIYFDGELFIFTTSPYATFAEDMTDIPYNFDDGDYFITKQGDDRIIYIYKRDFAQLAVQSFYLDGDTKLLSEMSVWPAKEEVAEAPVAPVIKDCTPEDGEYTWFTITLSATTEDGKSLDADKLYYNIYFDDEPFTFTNSPYTTFDDDMTDIPYGFDDGDYYITKQGDDRIVYVYKRDFKKLGVQSFYLDGEEKLLSDKAEWNNPYTSITSTEAANGENTVWLDLSGRVVKRPSHGIYFRMVKEKNGSASVTKQVVK